jgi:anti-sigma regulatory factor (Ser/Thr protein kinase)
MDSGALPALLGWAHLKMDAEFGHDALIYSDEDEFLDGSVPFLHGAVRAGEPALVAVRRGKAELLRGALGPDASAVFFADMEEVGRNPARIIPLWREFVDEHDGNRVRGIGEPVWPGRGAAEIDECHRHESLLNVAFVGGSAWDLLCSYDGRLSDQTLSQVAASHRLVIRDGVPELGAAEAVDGHCFAGKLNRGPATAEVLRFDLDGLTLVRRQVDRVAAAAGLASLYVSDLVVSASELAANSVAHGGGAGTLRTWVEDDRVVVEVADRGTIAEPLVGRVRPGVTQEGGRGLWLANQLCDLVQIRSGPAGTTIRLHMTTT